MRGMPGCSLKNECSKDANVLASPYCKTESLLSDICVADMPQMGICKNFSSVCTSSDCKPLPNLPTSAILTQQIYSICSEMKMDGCEKCKIASSTSTYADCDLLGTFGNLCKSMPDMSQCVHWNKMCQGSQVGLCDYSESDSPVMKMYFHSGKRCVGFIARYK